MTKEMRNEKAWKAREVKKKLIRESGYTCEVCGWGIYVPNSHGKGRNPINMHHMNPVAAGGDLTEENAIKLCPNHHAMVHAVWSTNYGVWNGPTNKEELIKELKEMDRDMGEYLEARKERWAKEWLELVKRGTA